VDSHRWSFGPFLFDVREHRLLRDGQEIVLQPKPAALLHILLRDPGALVSNETLLGALYPDVSVSTHALRQLTLKLRDALGEHAGWVETVSRRGVRFVGPVCVRGTAPAPAERWLQHVLPAERDTFFGRVAERAALERAFDSGCLATLIGPGGIGKTRLALRYAWETLEQWTGLWFCDLSAARDLQTAIATVARALEIETERGDAVAQLGHALAARGRCLLLLDNVETALAAVTELVDAWLVRSPGLHVLVTSRAALRLPGEHIIDVGPLERDDAAAMFVDRARAATAGFVPPDRGLLDPLLERLDAMPLAIELAAAQMRTMTAAELSARMDRRFEVMRAGAGRPPRHLTLRAALEGSWELLTDADRVALGELTLFEGGFSFSAAEGVLSDSRPAERIATLVDHGLVRTVAVGDDRRLRLLVTVRDFAAERARDLADAAGRHGAFYAALARKACEAPDAAERLAPDLADLDIACRRAVDRGDLEVAIATLRGVWSAHEGWRQMPELTERVLAAGGAERAEARWLAAAYELGIGRSGPALEHLEAAMRYDPDPELLVRLERARATYLLLVGRPAEALTALETVVVSLRGRPAEVSAVVSLGNAAATLGRYEEALEHYERALRLALSRQARAIVSWARGGVALALYHLGRWAEASVSYEAALSDAIACRDQQSEGQLLRNLGILHAAEGRFAEAMEAYQRSMACYRAIGDRRSLGGVTANLAYSHLRTGRFAEARDTFDEALALHRECGNRSGEANAVGNLGRLWSARGDPHRAEACYEASLKIYQDLQDRRSEALVLLELGELHLSTDLARASFEIRVGVEILGACGSRLDRSQALRIQARLHLQIGEVVSGGLAAAEAVELARGTEGDELAAALVVAAEAEARAGQTQAARRHLLEAEDLVAKHPHSPVARQTARLREQWAAGTPR
jgi:predicted ATPase/DNA-binding winged helix-turn-helix (wHTH) protein